MSETTMFDDGWAAVDLDEDIYPVDAVYGAAYAFLDRCHLFLERSAAGRVRVRLRAKSGSAEETRLSLGEMENELLAQTYRRRLAQQNRASIEAIASRAIAGAAGPPGLDELLAMEIGAETAFDDPLGIAMSWEEKYVKKKADKPAEEAPRAAKAADPGSEGAGGGGEPA